MQLHIISAKLDLHMTPILRFYPQIKAVCTVGQEFTLPQMTLKDKVLSSCTGPKPHSVKRMFVFGAALTDEHSRSAYKYSCTAHIHNLFQTHIPTLAALKQSLSSCPWTASAAALMSMAVRYQFKAEI